MAMAMVMVVVVVVVGGGCWCEYRHLSWTLYFPLFLCLYCSLVHDFSLIPSWSGIKKE
ncbi:conserved hypothetical protein [Ricinus communis]|uniref:Uncharacterized protein n=1 Tax=Ricinus communis TaxID=3988 RepID=B9SVU3_RICCO|nr:conserved hypothetical protein [Ricinus communis]